jgi:hypothetical protein
MVFSVGGRKPFRIRQLLSTARQMHRHDNSEYVLLSGRRLADGETIGAVGQARFGVSHAGGGGFVSFPVAR